MCIAISLLPNGHWRRCRECWQCKDRKISDWVGRCTAEAKTATKVDCITLTYGPDAQGNKQHMRSQLLVYEDWQKFIRAVRDAGHPVRFFVVGEYGSEKGRTHWHAILFWQAEPIEWPEMPHIGGPRDKRRWIKQWPHGHIVLDENPNSLKAVRYACKYIQKDETDRIKMGRSTKPALGELFFLQRAENMVREGIAPRDLSYRFGDHRQGKNRKLKVYYMHKGMGDKFLAHWVKTWLEQRPGQHMPESQCVDDYLDRVAEDQVNVEDLDGEIVNSDVTELTYEQYLEAMREERWQDGKAEEKRLGVKFGESIEEARQRCGEPPPPRKRYRSPRVHPIRVGSDQAWSKFTEDSLGQNELRKRRP